MSKQLRIDWTETVTYSAVFEVADDFDPEGETGDDGYAPWEGLVVELDAEPRELAFSGCLDRTLNGFGEHEPVDPAPFVVEAALIVEAERGYDLSQITARAAGRS